MRRRAPVTVDWPKARKAQLEKVMRVLIAVADKHLGKAIVDFVKAHPWPTALEIKILNVLEPFPLGSADPSYATEKLIEEDRKLGVEIVNFVSTQLKQEFPSATIEHTI